MYHPYGYNSFSKDFGSDILLEVDVPITDQDYCKAQYDPLLVTDEMLCAGDLDGGRGICYVSLMFNNYIIFYNATHIKQELNTFNKKLCMLQLL